MRDHLSLLLKDFESYFPSTKDPRSGKECMRNPLVGKPRESSTSVREEDQLLEIANDGNLKLYVGHNNSASVLDEGLGGISGFRHHSA